MIEFEHANFITTLLMGMENDRLFQIRFQAVMELYSRAQYYLDKGFREELPKVFYIKKAKMLMKASGKEEIKEILKPSEPYDNGNKLAPKNPQYHVEEEELMIWSDTSLMAPLNEKGFKRYQELFEKFIPDASIESPHMGKTA